MQDSICASLSPKPFWNDSTGMKGYKDTKRTGRGDKFQSFH